MNAPLTFKTGIVLSPKTLVHAAVELKARFVDRRADLELLSQLVEKSEMYWSELYARSGKENPPIP